MLNTSPIDFGIARHKHLKLQAIVTYKRHIGMILAWIQCKLRSKKMLRFAPIGPNWRCCPSLRGCRTGKEFDTGTYPLVRRTGSPFGERNPQ
jgi:hypothetical protein